MPQYLTLVPIDAYAEGYYRDRSVTYNLVGNGGNLGFDLQVFEPVTIPPWGSALIGLHVKAMVTDVASMTPRSFLLVPRSSLSKTPLMLANSVGVIDDSYRGELKAAVRNVSNEPYTLSEGRWFQIIPLADGVPFSEVRLVPGGLPPTERGSGGFGSTGR